MAMNNVERQARYRDKLKGPLKRIETILPFEDARKLDYLITYWNCSKKEAIKRVIYEAWEREGNPVYENGKLVSYD
jgi:hypothetical protein